MLLQEQLQALGEYNTHFRARNRKIEELTTELWLILQQKRSASPRYDHRYVAAERLRLRLRLRHRDCCYRESEGDSPQSGDDLRP